MPLHAWEPPDDQFRQHRPLRADELAALVARAHVRLDAARHRLECARAGVEAIRRPRARTRI